MPFRLGTVTSFPSFFFCILYLFLFPPLLCPYLPFFFRSGIGVVRCVLGKKGRYINNLWMERKEEEAGAAGEGVAGDYDSDSDSYRGRGRGRAGEERENREVEVESKSESGEGEREKEREEEEEFDREQ